jgi:hypothetical protein
MSTTTPTTILERLPKLRGEKARRWLELAVQQAFAFSRDVHGQQDPADVDAVRIMAVSVWVTSKGKPSWGKLDVDHCIELARAVTASDEALDGFTLDMNTFVCFLNKYALIDNRAAIRIEEQLEPLVAPMFARFVASQQQALRGEAMLN